MTDTQWGASSCDHSHEREKAHGLPQTYSPTRQPAPSRRHLAPMRRSDYKSDNDDAAARGWGMTNSTIEGYQAMYFDDVASAVEYCQALVPHIVRCRRAAQPHEERAVVWFHVPPRSTNTTHAGCYLFASTGAIAVARRAGLDTPLCGRVTRAALPPTSVLLFGEDAPPPTPRTRSTPSESARSAAGYPRTAARPVDVGA